MAILAECPICKTRQRLKNKECRCGEKLDAAKKSKRVRYWITYRLPGGKQRTEAVGFSIEMARDAEGKRRSQKRENRIFDILPNSKKTFKELSEWFLEQERIKGLASFKAIKCHVKLFNKQFEGRMISSLTRVELQGLQVSMKNEGYSSGYCDQVIDSIRWIITEALESEIIGGDCLKPFRRLKNLLRKGDNARKRVLSLEEFRGLYEALPKHSRAIVAMSFWTGMRQGEILKLTWDKVDLAKRMIYLNANDTKERRRKVVPIPRPLRDLMLQIPSRGKEGPVMTYGGKPVRDITQGIEKACEDAGIAYGRRTERGFIFHDLRHTFATNARKAGILRNVTMAIMGHSGGNDMNVRYDTVDEVDLLKASDQLEAYLGNVYQNVYQHHVSAK